MVINMNESLLRTIAQLQEFLDATPQVQFSSHGDDGDSQRYKHISAVLARFDYPRCSKTERGVVRAYLVRTSGYSRAQLTRLVARWGENRLGAVPLAKRYRAPAAVVPFGSKSRVQSKAETLASCQKPDSMCWRSVEKASKLPASIARASIKLWRTPGKKS